MNAQGMSASIVRYVLEASGHVEALITYSHPLVTWPWTGGISSHTDLD